MSGIILDPIESPEAIMANFQRIIETITAMQGGSIAVSQIVGYEDLVTKTAMVSELAKLRTENEKLRYGVGDVHISTRDTNPAEYFGYGTWEQTGKGRTIIGHGTTTDARGEEKTLEAGETGGAYKHKQTIDELPKHRIKLESPWSRDKRGPWYKNDSDTITEHGYESGSPVYTDYIGSDKPFNITQPYVVMYIWKRTA